MSKLKIAIILWAAITALGALAQEASQSSGVRRGGRAAETAREDVRVSARMQDMYGDTHADPSQLQWLRYIYRSLDLEQPQNAALYYPEDAQEDGQESMIRLLIKLLAQGRIAAYEYVDGRESFTDRYKLNVGEMLERFHIPFTQAKGSTEKAPRYEIDDNDIPAYEVLSYYILERYEFDTRENRVNIIVEALCPVLHREGDFGMDAVKYPMFWVKVGDIRPYLAQQDIFVDDDNNLARYTYDDFFTLNMYKGDIYKTRNHANKSLVQLYPDPEDLKRAQDSIQARLDAYDDHLWVPTREELEAMKQANDSTVDASQPEVSKPKVPRRSQRARKPRESKVSSPRQSSGASSGATRSVRRRR